LKGERPTRQNFGSQRRRQRSERTDRAALRVRDALLVLATVMRRDRDETQEWEAVVILLREKDTVKDLAPISEDELQFLVDQLEEEALDDRDYFVNAPTLDLLRERGCPARLLALLESTVARRSALEVEWVDTENPDRLPPVD
jgi:hypothetical protein